MGRFLLASQLRTLAAIEVRLIILGAGSSEAAERNRRFEDGLAPCLPGKSALQIGRAKRAANSGTAKFDESPDDRHGLAPPATPPHPFREAPRGIAEIYAIEARTAADRHHGSSRLGSV